MGDQGEDLNPDLPQFVEDDEDEKEDTLIRKSDALIVTATVENDFNNLEIYIFEEDTSNLYIHHEIMLPAPPLDLEWINFTPGVPNSKANYMAVATFMPQIEVWNLDVLDCV